MNQRGLWVMKPSAKRLFQRGFLLLVLVAMLAQPVGAAARPLYDELPDPLQTLVDSGDAYITGIGQAGLLGMEIMSAVEAINATPVTALSEESVASVRAKAREMAEQSAVALGAADGLAEGVEALSVSASTSIDVFQLAAGGVPDEMALDLIETLDFTPSQVDDLEAAFQATGQTRQDATANGLPTDLEDQLLSVGFDPSVIDQIGQAIGVRGLADTSLESSLAQFRASQDELAGVRTRALLTFVQLIGKQIGVRQASGIGPRAVTEEELADLAEVELRLLIHVAHLEELWGGDPRLEVGEGDWWFIERYAARAAERLEALTLEAQNRALVVDLLLVEQMRTLAITARSGDPDYVKLELDRLAELLEVQLGEIGFTGEVRGRTAGVVGVLAKLASAELLRERVSWPVDETLRETSALALEERLKAQGVENLQFQVGAIEELNEDNNALGLVFAAGLPYLEQLAADVLLAALDLLAFIQNADYLAWIEAILTGDTEDPALMVGNVLFSLIPVLGVIPDIYSLVAEPSIFVKALSIFGIIGSLGDLIGLIPGLQGVGGASFLGDAASAVLKTLFRHGDEAAQLVLNGLKLDEAFGLIVDLIGRLARLAGDTLGGSLDEVIDFITDLFSGNFKLWDNFQAFVARVGGAGVVRLGFDEGAELAGRILRVSDELAARLGDDAIEAIVRVGNDLPKYGLTLADMSDEAVIGLGKIVDDVGEKGILDFLGELSKLNDETLIETLELIGQKGVAFNWTEDALQGASKLVRRNGAEFVENALNRIAGRYDDDIARQTFELLGKRTPDIAQQAASWSDEAVDGLAKIINRTDPDIADGILSRVGGQAFASQTFEWLDKVGDLNSPHFEGWAKGLTQEGANWSGAMFELYVGAEELPTEFIAVFQDYQGGKQGMDFLLDLGDGRHFVEAKAAVGMPGSYPWDNMIEQFRRNLGLLGSEARYPPDGIFEYIIQGPYRQDVVDALMEIADEAWQMGNLFTEFGPENIRFIESVPWK
jgi:hypothetical protein